MSAVDRMAVIARRWIVEGTGAAAPLSFVEHIHARLYHEDIGGLGEVVEYVPAEQLRGAVKALRELSEASWGVTQVTNAEAAERWNKARDEAVAILASLGGQ